ncbi:MAG: glycine cleavage system aminomethyltransferase GcvT [Acidobacteria bacterium]|nr:glycine cleavage system aminomethyltransferase GcvT [Acidobacteriota bacterium]
MTSDDLRRTPLHAAHLAAKGRMVPFAGWEMPVQYSGVMDEHRAVRSAAGLFDVSHMGEVRVTGAGAEAFLQHLTPNDVSKLAPGRIHYSALLTRRGTYVDDLLVYRLTEDEFLLVVNAANLEADFEWIASQAPDGVTVEDVSARYALLALQGPMAETILKQLTETELAKIRYYRFRRGRVAGVRALISRTGYTGEDGFELYVAPERAEALWRAVMEAGSGHGLVPAGLGARDTLRLEAGMALYGHELDDATTAWEAGLAWTVKMDSGDFIGRAALAAARESRPSKKLAGFEIRGRGIARAGCVAFGAGREIGRVTSGTFSPTLERALGMAYLAPGWDEVGRAFEIDVRGRRLPAEVVELPFYKRA